MNWNDWEAVWKRQDPPIGIRADVAVLAQTFEAKRRKVERTLFTRDIVEASAGILVSAVFAYQGFHMKKTGWPIALTVALTLGVSAFFVRERIRAHRKRLPPTAPMLAKLEADIAELRHQRRLLLNVATWYLAPCILGMVIFGATMCYNAQTPLSTDPVFQTIFWTSTAFLYWGIWALNRRAVHKQVDPRLEELEKLKRELLVTD